MTPLVTYLVAWDETFDIKAGITTVARYEQFRGSRVHYLHLDDGNTGLERKLLDFLSGSRYLEPAFWYREQAIRALGGSGAGWTETFHANCRAFYEDALATCAGIMHGHSTGQSARNMRWLMHGRTDGRTNEEPPRRRVNLKAVDAHAHTGIGVMS